MTSIPPFPFSRETLFTVAGSCFESAFSTSGSIAKATVPMPGSFAFYTNIIQPSGIVNPSYLDECEVNINVVYTGSPGGGVFIGAHKHLDHKGQHLAVFTGNEFALSGTAIACFTVGSAFVLDQMYDKCLQEWTAWHAAGSPAHWNRQ